MELTRLGLVGKVILRSNMSSEEIKSEIQSVFKAAMGESSSFPFKILQTVGGGSKTLFDPH